MLWEPRTQSSGVDLGLTRSLRPVATATSDSLLWSQERHLLENLASAASLAKGHVGQVRGVPFLCGGLLTGGHRCPLPHLPENAAVGHSWALLLGRPYSAVSVYRFAQQSHQLQRRTRGIWLGEGVQMNHTLLWVMFPGGLRNCLSVLQT